MKKIFLILSLLFLQSCANDTTEVPVEKQYVVDVTNQVCAEYNIVDKKNYKFELSAELPLIAGGPCDRLIGLKAPDFKVMQNWVRDLIKKFDRQEVVLP